MGRSECLRRVGVCTQVVDPLCGTVSDCVSVCIVGNVGRDLCSSSSCNHVSRTVKSPGPISWWRESSDTGSHLNVLASVCLRQAIPPPDAFYNVNKTFRRAHDIWHMSVFTGTPRFHLLIDFMQVHSCS